MKYYFLLLLLITTFIVRAQPASKNLLEIKAANVDGVVKLRWAPTSFELWKLGREKGFIIEKVKLIENNQLIDSPETKILTDGPILPADTIAFKPGDTVIPQIAVIVQAFWGDSFNPVKRKVPNSASILNSSNDNDIRMVFSLMAADQNFDAAVFAGWGYVDKQVVNDGYYKYRIKLNGTLDGDSVITDINVNMAANNSLPAPFGLKIELHENLARLTWEHSLTAEYFSGYYIERSVDNKVFSPLNEVPLIISDSDINGVSGASRGELIDSIENNQFYYYRIQGLDCFGQRGPYSKSISGMATQELKDIPRITGATFINSDTVTIHWDFSLEEEPLLKGFDLLRADSINGQYSVVSGLLPVANRSFNAPMVPSNYFIVRALGANGDYTASGAIFVQQPDNTPPNKPDKPQWKIDSTGVVTLWWAPNQDKDIKGYAVYYARIEGEEFFRLNVEPLLEPIFHDTIDLNTFIEHVYYQIRAIDVRNNHSIPSDTTIVKLPDILPPVSPYFLRYNVACDSVQLEWVNSGSDDVAFHQLFRKKREDLEWREILQFDSLGINRYTDKGLEEHATYQYYMIATDDDGLKSKPSIVLEVKTSLYKIPKPVEKFSASLNRDKKTITLKWEKNTGVEGFQLYKQEGEFAPFLYQFISSSENKLIDKEIKPFCNYSYKIRSKGKNGLYSEFKQIQLTW